MKRYFLLLAASVALVVTSCTPFQVKTDYAQTAQFTDYKTYQFRVDDLKINDLDKDRVLNEVAKNLQSKGLSASQTPDLIINLKASHKKIEDIRAAIAYSAEAKQAVNLLYNQVLGRNGDANGINLYQRKLSQGSTLNDIRQDLANSDEAKRRR